MAHSAERTLAAPMAAATLTFVMCSLALAQPTQEWYARPQPTASSSIAATRSRLVGPAPSALSFSSIAPLPLQATTVASQTSVASAGAADWSPARVSLGWAAAILTSCACWVAQRRPSAARPTQPLSMCSASATPKRSQADCLNDAYLLACRQVFTSLDLSDNLDPATASSILGRSLKHGKVLLNETKYDAATGVDVFVNWPPHIWGDMARAREWGLTHILRGSEILQLLNEVKEETIVDIMRDIPNSDLSLEVTRSQPPLVYAVLLLSATLAFLLADMRHGDDAAEAREAAMRALTRVKLALGFTCSPRMDLQEIMHIVEESYEGAAH